VAENMNKAIKLFQEGRSIRHAADLSDVLRTCLGRRIIVEGNTTMSKGGQTVFTSGNKNCWALSSSGAAIHPLAIG
jgi:hypothetical protein